jgi:hypothetical protein
VGKLSLLEHLGQTTRAVQRHQIITAAHMRASDEYLRHGASARDFHHVLHGCRVLVNANFFDGFNAFGFENAFRTRAIRANGGGVHFYSLHGVVLGF